jgi:bifunctional non-homologous end joining protein LigD
VSAPLEWSEVTPKLDPSKFNIRTMPKRVAKKGDAWKNFLKDRLDLEKTIEKLEAISGRSR